ncbi:aminoglycoside phosphotransferase family protein [Candidatus Bathyarchaeota archaeon]|nr:aminoglycoside phosphotransferase family protein [Candidatus Bathyarchaeota archaeon]
MESAQDIVLARMQYQIREAIKEWIKIDILKTFPIAGGVSGASVHYVSADLSFPGLAQDKFQVDFVAKFSDKRTFRNEQERYESLPPDLKQYFINFSAITRQVSDEFCMVMEHLRGFQTLDYLLHSGQAYGDLNDMMERVLSTLKAIHAKHSASHEQTDLNGLSNIFRLYITDIASSISKAQKVHGGILKDLYKKETSVNGLKISPLLTLFNEVRDRWKEFESSNTSFMHGDCHARNIMVNPRTLDLKFIDIDNLDQAGDSVYDLGELLADLEVFGYIFGSRRFSIQKDKDEYSYEIELPKPVEEACKIMRNSIGKLDKKDEKRLELAKARYLLSMVPYLSNLNQEKILATYLEAICIMQKLVVTPS